MRGFDERAGALFSYVDLEKRVHADHPLRAIRSLTNAALSELSRDFAGLYSGLGRPSIAPEMLLRAMLFAGVLLGALGTPADGAAGVRSAVPLVCRAGHRRCGVGPLDLLEKPRPTFGWRDRSKVFECGSGAARGQAAVVERALLGRWHTDRSLGFDEELQAERPAGRRWSTRCRNASRRA